MEPSPSPPLPVVQGLWYGRPVLSQMERLSIESFIQNGHAYHLYAYDELQGVPAGAVVKDAREILPTFEVIRNRYGKTLGAAFSDLFRYKLLLERGQFWADLDVVCLKPFRFAREVVLAGELHQQRQGGDCRICGNPFVGVNCNVMRFPAGSREMLYCYERAVAFDRTKLEFGELGPRLITECAERFGLLEFVEPPETFNPVHYFEATELVDPRKRFAFSEETHAIHLWSGHWVSRTWLGRLVAALLRSNPLDRNARYPVTTVYGQLLDRYLYAKQGRDR